MSALLLATLPNLDPPVFLAPVIAAAAGAARTRLTIVLFSRRFNHPARHGLHPIDAFPALLRLLTYVYVHATAVAHAARNVLLPINVLLHGNDRDLTPAVAHAVDIVFRVAGDSIAVPLPVAISSVRQSFLPPAVADNDHPHLSPPIPPVSPNVTDLTPPFLPVVALGGTFDHLHAGHKILLSMAAFITSRRLIVGLTVGALLRNKKHAFLVQPFATRAEAIRDFLSLFRPGIVCDIAPLNDVYGPTGWDPNVQGLVVSHETLDGADAIAAHRASQCLPVLQTFVIDVISPSHVRLDPQDMELLRKTKMSSTFIREWIFESMDNKDKEEHRTR